MPNDNEPMDLDDAARDPAAFVASMTETVTVRTARARPGKHTPGPWSVRDLTHRGHAPLLELRGPDDKPIAAWTGFDGLDRPLSETRANLRLMKAAPDLLAALRLAAIWTEALPSDSSEKIAADNAVRAAIRKAAE